MINLSSSWPDLLQIIVSIPILYELAYSLGPAPIVEAHLAQKTFRVAHLRGRLRRIITSQSTVQFAPGTGMLLRGTKSFKFTTLPFEVDVVIFNKLNHIIAVVTPPALAKRVRHHDAAGMIVVNRGEASAFQLGETITFKALPKG